MVIVSAVCVGGLIFVFFFSSRRRHTRCSRDWSSDVCSSDLCKPVIAENPCGFAQNNDFGVRRRVAIPDGAVPRARDDFAFVHQHRSDRHFSGVSRRAGLVEGLLHVGIVRLCHRRENNTRRSKKDLALNYFPKSRIAVSLAAFFFAKKNAYPSILGSA